MGYNHGWAQMNTDGHSHQKSFRPGKNSPICDRQGLEQNRLFLNPNLVHLRLRPSWRRLRPPPPHSDIEDGGFLAYGRGMGKAKNPATGEGFLGEIMVHKISHAVGVVETVVEARDGWSPQIVLKLADGSLKKGRLSDFRDASAKERAAVATT